MKTNKFVAAATAVAVMTLLAGCATPVPVDAEQQFIDQSKLPVADVTLTIPGLGPCTDNPDRSLQVNSKHPLTVLVHGCFGSPGQLRGLAQGLVLLGQQTACFTYNDRDSMVLSSAQLNTALNLLGQKMDDKRVTVIGHSQGALIARKALVSNRPDAISNVDLKLRLVTVSGPFAGITAARQCGDPLTRLLTVGLIGPLCKVVTGDKWSEITYNSAFILQPGALHKQVDEHLQVVTDEGGSCRQSKDGVCTKSDEIFTLGEQSNATVDRDPIAKIVKVRAGHVEIVGNRRDAPVKLIAILRQHGFIDLLEPTRTAKLNGPLTRLPSESD
jgi:Putative serine esterase (DUF676)